ncbi:transposase [Hymenobacter sp. GOD-10R]|uniref:transposase n=1 Tax=Hymenobacter sp. GOD-10R TaxID=3093922 RepID=UPI002D7A1043|nr:transposase [Hymenobacter sp. GOD-10R]WRQ31764.1 transposase [Hymenobacter sp. GOD-10R]
MRRVRQRTVEPVFGNLLHHYGLRRINVRGRAGAHKSMLLAAIAYNLKKLLRYSPEQQLRMAIVLPLPPPAPPLLLRCGRRTRRNRTKGRKNLVSLFARRVLQQPRSFSARYLLATTW